MTFVDGSSPLLTVAPRIQNAKDLQGKRVAVIPGTTTEKAMAVWLKNNGLMLRRGDPAFRLAVNRVLARLYRSGEIPGIYRRWLGSLGRPSSLLLAMYVLHSVPE
jgi:ABC-type amino acid transport substrate-binding protein